MGHYGHGRSKEDREQEEEAKSEEMLHVPIGTWHTQTALLRATYIFRKVILAELHTAFYVSVSLPRQKTTTKCISFISLIPRS